MTGRTHVAVGVAASTPLALETHAYIPVLAGAVLGSLLPDCDTGSSTLGRWFHVPLRHRGPLHSLLAALVASLGALALVAWLLPTSWLLLPVSLAIGYVLHLLADKLTGRVPLLWPLRRKRLTRRAWTRTL